MLSGRTKKIVVLKNIPSNIIEEAILILKSDVENDEIKMLNKETHNLYKRHNDFLIKEAYSIINNYIAECKAGGKTPSKPINKSHNTNKKFLINTAINLALMGSIVLLILIISRIV